MKYSRKIKSTSEMISLGEEIGKMLRGGECFVLIGDVGAGKTTFTKGLAKGLEITEPIQSPTFAINRVYQARDGLRLSHYDFYRLNDAGIMASELDEAQADEDNVLVIEWADIVKEVLPEHFISISLQSPSETERVFTLTTTGDSYEHITKGLN